MKPKGLAVMLLSKAKQDGEEGADDEGMMDMPPGEEVAQELLDAIKSRDAKAVWHAFRGLAACAEHDDSEEDEEAADSDE